MPSHVQMCALSLLALIGSVKASEIVVHFKQSTMEISGQPRLDEVLIVNGSNSTTSARLGDIDLGGAPMPGHRASLSSDDVLMRIRISRPELVDSVVWEGPRSATVIRSAVELSISDLRQTAEETLRRWLEARYRDVNVEAIPVGDSPLRVSKQAKIVMAVQGTSAAERMAVWATVREPGLPDRSLPIWFAVSASAEAWVATRNLSAGSEIDDDSVRIEMIDIARSPGAAPATPTAISDRWLVAPISQGSIILSRMLVDKPTVVAGDSVRMRAREGSVVVESTGVAQQSAAKGQRVRVLGRGSGDAVSARVINAGLVEVMP